MASSIYDVAKRAGVSITTVSHALSGNGRVAQSTRERILEAAQELGWTANPHAQSLVSGRSRTVAIQVQGFTTEGRASVLLPDATYFLDLLNGAAAVAAENGYGLVVVPYDLPAERTHNLTIDGAVIVDPAGEEGLAAGLRERQLPVVTTGRPTRGHVTLPWVDNDHTGLTVRMLDHLVAVGYTRPAVISTSPTRSYVSDIIAAYRQWSAERSLEPIVVELPEPPAEGAAARAAQQLLERAEAPDAIYTTYDRLALGILLEARRLGIDVPEQLGLASAADSQLLQLLTPTVTSVELDAAGIGGTAVRILLELLELDQEGPPPGATVIDSEIIPRESTRRATAPRPKSPGSRPRGRRNRTKALSD